MFKLMFKNVKKRDQNIDLKKSVKMVTNQNHDKKSAKNIKIVSDVACQTSSAKSFHKKHFIEKNLKSQGGNLTESRISRQAICAYLVSRS